MPTTGTEALGRIVLFIVILLIATLFVTNPNFREKTIEVVNYVINKVKCVFGFGCIESNQDKTAENSAQALACALDATAYWSEGSPTRMTDLQVTIKDIEAGKAGVSLFTNIKTCGLGEKVAKTSAPTTCTPKTCTPKDGKEYYCNEDKTVTDCGLSTGDATHPICKAGTGCIRLKCPECSKNILDPCPETECAAISKNLDSLGYGICKFKPVLLIPNECKPEESEAQADARDTYRAEKIVRDNPGRAIRFGKTAVVCRTDVNSGEGVNPYDWITLCIPGDKKCAIDGNIYQCTTFSLVSLILRWTPSIACPYGCAKDKSTCATLPDAKSIVCKVKQFELPQDVDTDVDTIFLGNIADFVAGWMHWVGEPRYLVYFETFPDGIESVWTYSGKDAVMTAAVIGGVMNVGFGPFKAGAAAIKQIASKEGIAILKREGAVAMLSAAKGAATKELIAEYGTKAAIKGTAVEISEKIILGKATSALTGREGIELAFGPRLRAAIAREYQSIDTLSGLPKYPELKKIFPSGDEEIPRYSGIIDDFGELIRSDIPITDEVVEDVIGLRTTSVAPTSFGAIATDLQKLRSVRNADNLFTAGEKAELEAALAKAIKLANEPGLLKLATLSTKEGLGIRGNIKKFTGVGKYPANIQEIMDLKANDIAKIAYRDHVVTLRDLPGNPGDYAIPTTIRGQYVQMLKDAWEKNYADATLKEAATEVWSRAESLLKGVTGMPHEGLPSKTRTTIMAVALAGSYLANLDSGATEKYGTCGTGTLCLHTPKWFGEAWFSKEKGNNMPFELTKEVKTRFDDLIMTTLPGGPNNLRMNLVSPCKTDLTVTPNDAAGGRCKCEDYTGGDEIAFKLQKVSCVVSTGNWLDPTRLVYTLPDGRCPATVKGKINAADPVKIHEVETVVEDYKYWDTIYKCPVTNKDNVLEDLEFCGREKIYDLTCLETNKGIPKAPADVHRKKLLEADSAKLTECLYDLFRECTCTKLTIPEICSTSSLGGAMIPYYLDFAQEHIPDAKLCDVSTGGSLKARTIPKLIYDETKYSASATAKMNLDIFFQPLNLKPNIHKGGSPAPVSMCTDSWVPELISGPPAKKDCLTVSVDVSSLKVYGDEGFGRNFCGENRESAANWVETGCEWGGIAISLAAIGLTSGAATPVVMFSIGTISTACAASMGNAAKWPNNQF